MELCGIVALPTWSFSLRCHAWRSGFHLLRKAAVIFCLYTGRGLGQTNRTPGVSTQRGHEKASNERTKIMHPFLIVSYPCISERCMDTSPASALKEKSCEVTILSTTQVWALILKVSHVSFVSYISYFLVCTIASCLPHILFLCFSFCLSAS